MTREEQDKLWAELSEESQKKIIDHYYGDTAGIGFQYEDRKECYKRLFGEHNLNPILTYDDVVKELGITDFKEFDKKLEAIGKLMVVTKFLNRDEEGIDWGPNEKDWDYKDENFYTLGINPTDKEICVIPVNKMRLATEIVFFRTQEIAEKAIQILGKDVIITAFTTKY